MKKAVKIISLALAVIIVGVMLVSCSKMLSGTYSSSTEFLGNKSSYKFSGSNVALSITILGASTSTYDGKYEIKNVDGKQKITFTFEGDGSSFSGTYSFNEGKDNGGNYIEIDGSRYYKN